MTVLLAVTFGEKIMFGLDKKRHQPVVQTGKHKRYISLKYLSKEEKRQVWTGIKKVDPAKADMMSNDPHLKKLVDAFNGEFVVLPEQLEIYKQAGQDNDK